MKKTVTKILSLALSGACLLTLAACGKTESKSLEIAVPNDTTNEARALLLLEDNGYITLDPEAGITATIKDITENPYNLTFKEVEAAQIPNVLQDVDYGIINSNFAIQAGINPVEDSLTIEGSSSAYANVLCVKEGNENSDAAKALIAAVSSQKVADYIAETYGGAVVSAVENPGNGFDDSVDYAALAGTTITVAASPTPHAEILALAKETLAEKDVTLEIRETLTMSSPTTLWKAAMCLPTSSSMFPTWTTSTSRTAPMWSLLLPSMWSPWASTAASRPLWTPSPLNKKEPQKRRQPRPPAFLPVIKEFLQ